MKITEITYHQDQFVTEGVKASCPHCAGPMFSEELMMEKKDACYYKVKSRYKVWPSAYASGALVKCRKKGAKNWGTKSESVEELDENLHQWFKEKWVRFGPDGKIRGDCARGDDSEGKPKCLPQSKAQSLGKAGRKYAASKKRREDPNPERHGPAKNVATKKKSNESMAEGLEKQQYLWHGSRQKIDMLEPRQSVDTGGAAGSNQNAIYATSDPKVAIAMGLTTPGSDTGMFPNDPQMVLFKGNIRKGENVYIHKLPFYGPDGKPQFVQGGNTREFHSIPGVKGIKPVEIKAVPVDKYLNLIRQATPADLELQKKYMKQDVAEEQLDELKCWPGYSRVQGVPAGAPGSCKKKTNESSEDSVQIKYWQQDTQESGQWAKTKPMPRNKAEQIVRSFPRGEIVDVEQDVSEGENWSKYNHKRVGGMSKKSVSSYRRSHPGSKIQTAVTTKPSKLKKGSKAAARRKSFCARMRGMKKHRTGAKTARDPNSNINKSLRRWHCESVQELQELVMIAEQKISKLKK